VAYLKSLVLRLWDKEKDPQEHEQTEDGKEDICSKPNVSDHGWGCTPDDKVHHPILIKVSKPEN